MASLYRKYRPQRFADVVGQEHVKTTIQSQLTRGEVAHAYLFMGPRGVGKTTIARLLAKTVNCEKPAENQEPCNACNACTEITAGNSLDVYEIDAASHTDVDNVRENIIKNVRFAPNKLTRKVFIIDEVHMLSTSAFNALLKTLEEPPAHALFVLATTEIHKIPDTIISRCQRFDFSRMTREVLAGRLQTLATKEGVTLSDDVVEALIRGSDGCVRDAESLLGQVIALGDKEITMETASLVLPEVTTGRTLELIEGLVASDKQAVITGLRQAVFDGVDLDVLRDELIRVVRDMMMHALSVPNILDAYDASMTDRLTALAPKCSQALCQQLLNNLLEAKRRPRSEQIPQLSLELALLSLITTTAEPVQQDFKKQEVASVRPESSPAPAQVESSPAPPPPPVAVTVESTSEETEPIVSQETVAEGVPVLAIAEVQQKWPTIFQQIKKASATLPFALQGGTVTAINGDQIELSCGFQLHADAINKDKNRHIIEASCEQVLGKKVSVKAVYQHKEADDTVASLVQEFGGSVV